jgi:hypothetical protein
MITKIAKKNVEIQDYFKEFSKEYFLLFAVKLLISIFSFTSALTFTITILNSIINVYILAVFISFAVLLLIELFSYYLISKSFKFLLKKHFFNAIVFLVLSIVPTFFSVILSANSLNNYVLNKYTDIETIEKNENLELQNIENQYNADISLIEKNVMQIETNPAGWAGGRRSVLLSSQLNEISNLNAQILRLRASKRNDIQTVKQKFELLKTSEIAKNKDFALNFYYLCTFLILIQYLLSFIYSFMSMNIYKSFDIKDFILTDIKEYKTRLMQSINTEIVSTAKEVITEISQDFNRELATERIEIAPVQPITAKKQKIGFMQNTDVTENTDVNVHTSVSVQNTENQNITKKNTAIYGIGICPNCAIEFTKNSYNHKFCKENCRIEFAEKKTGKNLSRYKNIKK